MGAVLRCLLLPPPSPPPPPHHRAEAGVGAEAQEPTGTNITAAALLRGLSVASLLEAVGAVNGSSADRRPVHAVLDALLQAGVRSL